MEKKELIITTAKEIFLKLLERSTVGNIFSTTSGKPDEINLIGDQFKIIVSKVESAFQSIQ